MYYFQPLEQFEIYELFNFFDKNSVFFNVHNDLKYITVRSVFDQRYYHEAISPGSSNLTGLRELFEEDVADMKKYGGLSFIYNNATLYFVLILLSLYFFLRLGKYRRRIWISNSWEFLIEKLYYMVLITLEEQVGAYGLCYFPIFFSIFIFILISNLIGLTPYGFTITSFIIKTFTISLTFLIALTIIGIVTQGPHFFDMFLPKGVPVALVPVLMIIEIISYVSRAFSLAIRLFANMMSGHSLLNILAGFTVILSKKSIFFGLIPFLIVLAITFLEVGIACLQAYVFVVLLSIYLNDSINGSH